MATVQTSTVNVGDIFYDPDLEQYVGIALDEHEVYGVTHRACSKRLREVNDVIIEHAKKNGCQDCKRDCRTAFPACQKDLL